MAKHVILEQYTFDPATRTVTIRGKNIRREQLLLITNVTRNTVIFNFSDPNLGAASYTNSITSGGINAGLENTIIVLSYNTSSMASTDRLAILTEETYQEITPNETLLDPVGKMRVSEPQSLIDTDFEYGIQPTKWETLTLLNFRPSAYYNSEGTILFSNITGSFQGNNTVIVNLANTQLNGTDLFVGQPIFVQGSRDQANVDGWFTIHSIIPNSSFTYKTIGRPVWDANDPNKTYVFAGQYYSNAGISLNNVSVSSNVIFISTTNAHGLRPGNGIWLQNITGSGTIPQELNGSWIVSATPSSNTLVANAYNFTGAGPLVSTNAPFASNILYMRPFSTVVHRPFDGGVSMSTSTASQGYQTIRQTRRYFRYQSGKGIQFSTGSIMKPALTVESMTSFGSNVTVYSKYPHNISIGCNVIVYGANEVAYNGSYPVTAVANTTVFTYQAGNTPTATRATGYPMSVHANNWYGSKNRLGMFDDQNGFFFEFDGQQLYVVKRSSTQQMPGVVTVRAQSPVIDGIGTSFSETMIPGDFVSIRGMTYLVESILSDTQMIVNPEYRGVNAFNCTVSKIVDIRIPQSQWNIDRMDGTGASGMALDLTKMQMFYIDYSWYGAGAIRFGFKNNRGEVTYCHRIVNNNQNTEAYMRSGNMAARYETSTRVPYTVLAASLSSAASTGATVTLRDATDFPNVGVIVVTGSGNQGSPVEYISYSAKSANTLTIAQRALFGGVASANTFNVTSTSPVSVELSAPQNASSLNHWGSSVIMDGKYDDDKSLIFNIGQNNTLIGLAANRRAPIISLRISPSVDSGLTGILGTREVINRMQLVLRQMDAVTTGPYRVEVILNGRPSDGAWAPVGGSSLAQYAFHATGATIIGGENIFSFFTQSTGQTQQDMQLVRDLGTSIIGGGNSFFANTVTGRFPDGPDMITVCATPFFSNSAINSRISWTEAQA